MRHFLLSTVAPVILTACASAPALMDPQLALPADALAVSYLERGDIGAADADRIYRKRLHQICLGRDDAQHVERYDGELGPSRAFVSAEAPATARLVWNSTRVNAYYPQQGSIRGPACTGTLIAEDLILTAGHCIQVGSSGPRQTPLRLGTNGYEAIPPEDIGLLLDAEFNYQLSVAGPPRATVTFKVERVIEHTIDSTGNIGVDYALLKLAPLADGRKPRELFEPQDWDASDAAYDFSRELTVIQHPAGDFKKVHAGPKKAISENSQRRELRYASIDTLGSSSGSGVIDQHGRLIGIHVKGGCQEAVKYNSAVSLVAVRAQSAFFGQRP